MLRKKVCCLLLSSVIISSMVSVPVHAKNITTDDQQSYISVQGNKSIDSKQYCSDISKDEESLKNFLIENEVSGENICNLMDKLEKGEIWDSLKEEFKDIKPTSVQDLGDGSTQTKYIYPDGSIRISIKPSEENSIERSVNGGSWSGGSGYRNCRGGKVAEYTGVANAWFYADFTLVQGGDDYISNVYDYTVSTIGGDYSLDSFGITRRSEAYGNKAEAKLQFKFTAYSGSGATTCWIKLLVGNDTYYSASN